MRSQIPLRYRVPVKPLYKLLWIFCDFFIALIQVYSQVIQQKKRCLSFLKPWFVCTSQSSIIQVQLASYIKTACRHPWWIILCNKDCVSQTVSWNLTQMCWCCAIFTTVHARLYSPEQLMSVHAIALFPNLFLHIAYCILSLVNTAPGRFYLTLTQRYTESMIRGSGEKYGLLLIVLGRVQNNCNLYNTP